MNRRGIVQYDIIYLDFQKAFDKVPHQRLVLKLKAHGIGDSITDWIEQWLTDRTTPSCSRSRSFKLEIGFDLGYLKDQSLDLYYS